MRPILLMTVLLIVSAAAPQSNNNRGGAISGRVVDSDGRPLAGVSVATFPGQYFYIPVDYPDGRHEMSHTSAVGAGTLGAATTNDRGEYRLEYRPAGEYFLCVSGRNMPSCSEDSTGATFFPGTTEPSQSRPVNVRAGSDLSDVNIVVQTSAPRGVSISGTLLGGDGKIASAYKTTFYLVPTRLQEPVNGRGVLSLKNAVSDSDAGNGRYLLRDVPPGSYDFEVEAQGADWRSRVPLTVGSKDIENFAISLRPGATPKLEGRFVVNGTTSAFPFSSLDVRIFGDVYRWKGGGPLRVDSTGKIDFEGVGSRGLNHIPEGNYAIRVTGLPYEAHVTDIRQGGRSIYDGAKPLAYGIIVSSTPAPIEVIIYTVGASIEGTTAPGATVTLAPTAERRANPYLFGTASADTVGHFKLAGVAPGSYKVFSWESIPMSAHLNPAYLETHESESVAVSVTAAGRVENVRVPVIPSNP
jgi:hypothetical protein